MRDWQNDWNWLFMVIGGEVFKNQIYKKGKGNQLFMIFNQNPTTRMGGTAGVF